MVKVKEIGKECPKKEVEKLVKLTRKRPDRGLPETIMKSILKFFNKRDSLVFGRECKLRKSRLKPSGQFTQV